MKFIINCSTLKVGGGVQVAHSFVSDLHKYPQHQFLVVVSGVLHEQLKNLEQSASIKIVIYNIQPSILKIFTGNDAFLNKLEQDFKPNAVFTVFGASYWKPKAKHIIGYARPNFIYYESPYFKQISIIEKMKNKLLHFIQLHDFKHNNDCIVTENEDVTNRLQQILPSKKIVTVTNFYNQIFDNPSKWDNSMQLSSDENIFKLLTISANYPHKNLQIITKVIPILKEKYPSFNYKFYITQSKNIFEQEFAQKYSENIEFLGSVSINKCPSLYKQTHAMFLPTLLECFSASYPEAMVMKRIILTSDLSFARGICANAAVYFNPLNPTEIAEKIYETATNISKQNDLVKNGKERLLIFDTSAQRTKKYIKLLESIN